MAKYCLFPPFARLWAGEVEVPASWRQAQWITFRTIPLANLMESEIQENKMLETLSSEDGNGN
jgi:hypothetical protein